MKIDESGQLPDAITQRLAKGEKLVWWDRPNASGLARRELNMATFMGIFFVGFSVFWMTMAYRAPGPFFLFGLLFVGIGLWMVTTPLRAYWAASSMLFALTDKRALIIKGTKTTGFPLERLGFVETESGGDGSGNVLFTNESASPLPWGNTAQMMRKGGFIAVADAEKVGQEMLRRMEQRRTAPAIES